MKLKKPAPNATAPSRYEDFLRILTSSTDTAQSYQTLLSSLHLLNSTRPLKSILITSTQPEEGKTTVTINLALTMILSGKKALIVDADLRKPRIHQMLGLEDARGLSDYLTGNLEIQEVIQSVKVTKEGFQNERSLSVVPSGRVSPGSFNLIASHKVKQAIESLIHVYDVVLLDSPPTLSVSDALLLAPLVDGVILVVNTGLVAQKDALRAKDRLEQSGGHILGVVMNRFDEKLHGPGFHPYHSYYRAQIS